MGGKTSTKSAAAARKGAAKVLHRAQPARRVSSKLTGAKPVLLAGGNPQIAKAEGDAPVQAYIAAMPGWKRDVVRRLDALELKRGQARDLLSPPRGTVRPDRDS